MPDEHNIIKDWLVAQRFSPPEIVEFLNTTFYIAEIRQRVGDEKGIVFIVRSSEKNHPTPHVHAEYGEYRISISIEDGKVLEGNLPKKREKLAIDWVVKNKEKLLAVWRNYTISATSIMTKSLINTCFDED